MFAFLLGKYLGVERYLMMIKFLRSCNLFSEMAVPLYTLPQQSLNVPILHILVSCRN